MIYLASPYSHDSAYIQHKRFKAVCVAAAVLIAEGKTVFSPIAHSHPITLAGKLPSDWKYWEKYNKEMMDISESMIVLRIDGWEESVGIQAEIDYYSKLNKIIIYSPTMGNKE